MKTLALLVTGCGRSGTTYLSHCLCKSGYDVPHECVGALGTVSWYFATKQWHSVRPPLYKNPRYGAHREGATPDEYEFQHVVHLVRDPLKVIGSAAKAFAMKEYEFITALAPNVRKVAGKIPLSARYYIEWNKLVEREYPQAIRIRIEDIEQEWSHLCSLVDNRNPPFPESVNKTMNRNGGFRAPLPVTWTALKQVDLEGYYGVAQLAEKYGYTRG